MKNRKLFGKLFVVLLCFLLGGCGNSDVYDTIDKYFLYLDQADYDKALKLCDMSGNEYANVYAMTQNALEEEDVISNYLKNNSYWTDLKNIYANKLTEGYEIVSVSEEELTGVVLVNYNMVEDLSVYLADIELLCAERYMEAADYYNELLKEEGEEAVILNLLDAVMLSFYQISKDNILKYAEYEPRKYKVQLSKVDNKMMIFNVEEEEK